MLRLRNSPRPPFNKSVIKYMKKILQKLLAGTLALSLFTAAAETVSCMNTSSVYRNNDNGKWGNSFNLNGQSYAAVGYMNATPRNVNIIISYVSNNVSHVYINDVFTNTVAVSRSIWAPTCGSVSSITATVRFVGEGYTTIAECYTDH